MALVDTHWPNRPSYPFRWFSGDWGLGADGLFNFVGTYPDDPAWLLCITSMQLASQVDVIYFQMTVRQNGEEEHITELLVQPTSTLTISYPTPLVIGGTSQWDGYCGPEFSVGLFHATIVGYFQSLSDEKIAPGKESALRQILPRLHAMPVMDRKPSRRSGPAMR